MEDSISDYFMLDRLGEESDLNTEYCIQLKVVM